MLMIHQSTRELFLADVTQSRHGFDIQAPDRPEQRRQPCDSLGQEVLHLSANAGKGELHSGRIYVHVDWTIVVLWRTSRIEFYGSFDQ
jgi:hypothetical protein